MKVLVFLLGLSLASAKTITNNDVAKQSGTFSGEGSFSGQSPLSQEASISSEDINDLVVLEPVENDSSQAPEPSIEIVGETSSPATETNVDDTSAINKFCKCKYDECNCCRQFRMPIALLANSGCAKIRYIESDKISVGLSFGDRIVASRVISSRKNSPICMPLPGGYSKFCGRIYGISRRKDTDEFQACLGLELRADDDLEAALRVSCFNFGPRGLELTEAAPLPVEENSDEDEDDDDDEDDDIFGDILGGEGGEADDADDDDDDDDDDDSADTDDYR